MKYARSVAILRELGNEREGEMMLKRERCERKRETFGERAGASNGRKILSTYDFCGR